jgi:hypothetical protein
MTREAMNRVVGAKGIRDLQPIPQKKANEAAPTSPVLSAVRPQPNNDDSRGQEPLQAGSRFASLPTVAGLLLAGVVVQLLPIPSFSIRSAAFAAI